MNVIKENFAIYDMGAFPAEEKKIADGTKVGYRKLFLSPYTTGEPIMLLLSSLREGLAGEIKDLKSVGHSHLQEEEIMLIPKAAKVIADGEEYAVPANTMFVAKPGCHHTIVYEGEGNLDVLCIFTPSIPQNEDDGYPPLIEKTRAYLDTLE